MTFLAPSFIFIFLPVSLLIYALMPKYMRPYSLVPIGVLFYVAVNFESPFALIALPVTAVAVSISAELFKRKKNRVCLDICRVISVISIFLVLALRVIGQISTLSGIGVVITLMSAASLCSDVLWGQGRVPDSAWDTLVYLTFYPLKLVGPFVKYGDFVEKIDRINFGVENFTSGAFRFIMGFVKCVAVSAVLGEAYDRIYAAVDSEPGLASAVVLVLIRGIGFFSFISGYSDIAVGFSSMLGIRIGRDYGNFFCNVTPCEFIRNFFSSLLDFCRSYITVPVSVIVSGISGTAVAAVFAAFFYALVFSNNMETVYTLMIPLTIAMMMIVLRTGKRRKKVSPIPRVIGCACTFLLSSAVIWYIYMGGPEDTLRWLDKVFSTSAGHIAPEAINILRDAKFFIIPAVAGVCVFAAHLLFKRDDEYLDAVQRGESVEPIEDGWMRTAAKYIFSALLFSIFVFTIIMILPQYPYLASVSYFFPFV